MKNIKVSLRIIALFTVAIFTSCSSSEYELINQEIIKGKVSAIEYNYSSSIVTLPKIWIQDDKKTIEIVIPNEYKNQFKVGDTCLLIIQKFKDNETDPK